MENLFIKNGKINDSLNNVILPEIGNLDHIALLKKYDNARNNGINQCCIISTLNVRIDFKCLCGVGIDFEIDDIDVDVNSNFYLDADLENDISGNKCTCHNCKQKYIVGKDKYDNLIIKLK